MVSQISIKSFVRTYAMSIDAHNYYGRNTIRYTYKVSVTLIV